MSRDTVSADGEVPLPPNSAEGDAETDGIKSKKEAPVDDNAEADMDVPLPLDSAESDAETDQIGSNEETPVDDNAEADMDVPLLLDSAESDAEIDQIGSNEEAPVDDNAEADMDVFLLLDSSEDVAETDGIRSSKEAPPDCTGNCECPSIQTAADKEKSLHGAVETGDLETVKILLSEGTFVDAKNECGRTPLYFAVGVNNLEITEALLKYGANVNVKDREEDGITPLHVASLFACSEMTLFLLSNGASVNAKGYNGCTPLHYAVRRNELEISKLLLECGAEVSNADNSGFTPLHDAISHYADVELVKLLLNKEPRVDVEDCGRWSLLYYAIQRNNLVAAELLLEHGARINNDDDCASTSLQAACLCYSTACLSGLHDSNVEMAKMLLRKGARLNVKGKCGRTPLFCAVDEDNLEAAEFLLEWGADVNAGNDRDATPLDVAMSNGLKLALKRHIIKLKSANLFVGDKNLRAVSQDDQMTSFQLECEEEVERLKCEKICDGFSFFEVLTKNAGRLARAFAENEIIVRASKSDDFDAKFPIYGRIVNHRFLAFIERKELLGKACKLLNFLPLPEVCIMEILDNLRNTDLKNF